MVGSFVGFAQDRCPSFKVIKQRSGLHYELKKYKPKKLPREGIMVFAGGYASTNLDGIGFSGRLQMIEYGFSGGWDVRTTNPNVFNKTESSNSIFANAIGATLGKYYMIGRENRGLIDFGMGYGHSSHGTTANKIPVFGYGLASYRFYRDVWISGSVHVTDFKSVPQLSVGLATLLW